jgi:hypothetical protein
VQRVAVDNVAGLDERFSVHGHSSTQHGRRDWTAKRTWREIFTYISPYLMKVPHENTVKSKLTEALSKLECPDGYSPVIEDQDFQTIGIQLNILGLVKIQYVKATDSTMALFWSLTPEGEQLMLESRVVRSGRGET